MYLNGGTASVDAMDHSSQRSHDRFDVALDHTHIRICAASLAAHGIRVERANRHGMAALCTTPPDRLNRTLRHAALNKYRADFSFGYKIDQSGYVVDAIFATVDIRNPMTSIP